MREGLESAWQRGLENAGRWTTGGDPTPVLEALGLALVLEVTGELNLCSGEELDVLRRTGRRAVAAAEKWSRDHPAAEEDLLWAVGIARAALDALTAERAAMPDAAAADLVPPSPRRVLRMLEGQLDGLSAGSCAAHLLRDPTGRARLQLLGDLEAQGSRGSSTGAEAGLEPLRAAAAAAEDMWAPGEGESVASRDAPRVEAVLFRSADPPRLAVYAFEAVPLRLVSEAVETEAMLPGYWRGRIISPRARVLRCELHVEDRVLSWKIDLRPRGAGR